MKRYFWIVGLILLMTASCVVYVPSDETRYPNRGGTTYDRPSQEYFSDMDSSYFYEYLTPYGNWVTMSPYGYVWIPRQMGYRWHPYTYGRWVWTNYGWTWISNYEWGWIPFHYGRWGWDDDLGWFWVPGNVWGPAWVTWRSSSLYMGWAPLPPGIEFEAGIGLTSLPFDIPGHFWVFIEGRHFMDYDFSSYVLPFERNITIINYTVIHNNIYVRNNRVINEGVDIDEVRRLTRRDITRYQLRDAGRPGISRVGAGEVSLYRPAIRKNEAAKPKTYLNREEAREKIAPVKNWEPQIKRSNEDEESSIRKRHLDEERLLERSQAEEINDVQKKYTEHEKQIRDVNEKDKIKKDYDVKVSDLKKRHVEEKQQLKERQKKDQEQVIKKKVKKD
jgi:hypothetical protein